MPGYRDAKDLANASVVNKDWREACAVPLRNAAARRAEQAEASAQADGTEACTFFGTVLALRLPRQ